MLLLDCRLKLHLKHKQYRSQVYEKNMVSKHSWRLDEVGEPAAATRRGWARLTSCCAWPPAGGPAARLGATGDQQGAGLALLPPAAAREKGEDVRRGGNKKPHRITSESTNMISWKSIMRYY
jgi:hypothetical protein